MLIVSRKKVLLTRIIMWGGIAMAAVGAIVTYTDDAGMESIFLLAAGLIISLLASAFMNFLFRCPNCKKSVLTSDAKMDLRSTNCPNSCPSCGAPVQLKD